MPSLTRDTDALAAQEFDLLVVGAGIYGACIARDAALRGLSVALVEQGDFGEGTSHNSLKLLHGGFRYIQHLDFRRMRESVNERRAWMRIAPQMTRPLSCVMLTHGMTTRSRLALWTAGRIHGIVGHGANDGVLPTQHVKPARVLNRKNASAVYPFALPDRCSGAAIWDDGQILDPDRVLLNCVADAVTAGANVANYVAVRELINHNGRIIGANVTDQIADKEIEIRATVTVNAAGPWSDQLASSQDRQHEPLMTSQPKTMNLNLVVDRRPICEHAFGVQSQQRSDSLVDKQSRQFFITPWRDVTVIGTAHRKLESSQDVSAPPRAMAKDFAEQVADACPELELKDSDIVYCYWGVTPGEDDKPRGVAPRARHGRIIDHSMDGGPDAVLSVLGVKWTTSRLEAERVVDRVLDKLGRQPVPTKTDSRRLPECTTDALDDSVLANIKAAAPSTWTNADIDDVAIEYGSSWQDLMNTSSMNGGTHDLFAAKARYAVENEMAVRLSDVLLRRSTTVERRGYDEQHMRWVSDFMSQHFNWSQQQQQDEERMFHDDCRQAMVKGIGMTHSMPDTAKHSI